MSTQRRSGLTLPEVDPGRITPLAPAHEPRVDRLEPRKNSRRKGRGVLRCSLAPSRAPKSREKTFLRGLESESLKNPSHGDGDPSLDSRPLGDSCRKRRVESRVRSRSLNGLCISCP
ncbi:hypothetical protein KM043_008642 [Ampulex compressa]|nr:hypothetical protein KM043_008642 [Ampulex compressa]